MRIFIIPIFSLCIGGCDNREKTEKVDDHDTRPRSGHETNNRGGHPKKYGVRPTLGSHESRSISVEEESGGREFIEKKMGRRNIYFIRHANSEWNYAKNNGNKLFRKLKGATNAITPVYKDTPLTDSGIKQSVDLYLWLNGDNKKCDNSNKDLESIWKTFWPNESVDDWVQPPSPKNCQDVSAVQECSRNPKSREEITNLFNSKLPYIAVSNLRRAIQTLIIVLNNQLFGSKNQLSVYILSALQEISHAGDASSKLGAHKKPKFYTKVEGSTLKHWFGNMNDVYPAAINIANKYIGEGHLSLNDQKFNINSDNNFGDINGLIMNKRGPRRIEDFCKWAFDLNGDDDTNIIISGHSSWLQNFYIKSFTNDIDLNLSEKIMQIKNIDGVKVKLGNSSLLYFQIEENSTGMGCHVRPGTTRLLYGYWQISKKFRITGEISHKQKSLRESMISAIRNSNKSACPAV
jgi:hypothetical protein